jgi:acyl-CoA synthetase (AMP-forming)/AMP-acid ligase II
MIKSGGHRIAPREIEDAIVEHDAIHEAAVIGIPDELLDEQIKAVVVLRAGATLDCEELARFLKDRLPAYKIPKVVEFRDALPKSAAGKIDRKALG